MENCICKCRKINDEYEKILSLSVYFNDEENEEVTIRDYLYKIMHSLWRNPEAFKSVAPFGVYDWQHDFYITLIDNGVVNGALEENGDVLDIDFDEVDTLMFNIIGYLFGKE
jgi:hypothetical protein